jgi:hypothetical protein
MGSFNPMAGSWLPKRSVDLAGTDGRSSAFADFDESYRFSPLLIPWWSVRKPKLTYLFQLSAFEAASLVESNLRGQNPSANHLE